MADFSRLNLRGASGDSSGDSKRSEELVPDDLTVDELPSAHELDGDVEASESGSVGVLRAPFRLRLPGAQSPANENGAPSPAPGEEEEQAEHGDFEGLEGVELLDDEPTSGLKLPFRPSLPPVAKPSVAPVAEVPVTAVAVPEPVSTAVDAPSADAIELLEEDVSAVDELFPEDDSGDFDVSNPLLEEDDELWEGTEEPLSKTQLIRGVTGEIMDRDDLPDEDFETFEGFEGPAAVSPDSSSVVNPLLEEDDEYIPASVNPFLDDDDEELVEVESPKTDLDELRETVEKNAEPKRFFPEGLDPEFDKRVIEAPSRKEVVAAEREARIRKAEAAKAEAKEFKSEFQRKATETFTVNELGETKNERGRERKRLSKDAPKGKLATNEIEFFKNMGSRKSQYSEGLRTTELLAGPMNQFATAKEKRERKERLERVFDSRVSYRQGANFKLNEKMTQMLSFLALFRYATHSHIARMFGESPRTTLDRLYRMQANGLVESRKIYAQHAIWFLTEPGIIISGYDVRKITDSRLTYSMFPHQFTVNHIAANLWGGKLNVLNLPDFPSKNRTNLRGEPIFGEQLTSELEILSSFAKMKLFEDSASFRPKLMGMMAAEFKKWADGDRQRVPSPELVYGNEWMFTLFPSLAVGVAYHVPDLVVKRQRAANGAPRSIAVEIEINNKPIGSYKKTLQAYAEDKRVFDKVVWVCKTIGPAKKLEQVGRELGIYQSGKLKIVPIFTNDGVFKGRDLWTI